MSDNRLGVGATSQHAEIVVPATLANLLRYSSSVAHPPVIVLVFYYYQYRDHFHDVQDLQFMYGTRSLLHVSEAGSRWGELPHIFESKGQLSETVTKYKVCEL